jgi:hypothetical protein
LLNTIILFCLRYIFSLFWYPDSCILLKMRIQIKPTNNHINESYLPATSAIIPVNNDRGNETQDMVISN